MTATARQRHGPVATARAILLDRDGTLVEARHFPTRPEELVLSAGLKQELLALQESGFQFVVATNQSGLARGLFDEAALDAMHDRVAEQPGAVLPAEG
jgi:D-glycero-D-manno-heptose 1,7-bisphosphate phosphatase